ncbi:hypothetical protein HK105_201563 [Polyrhizophydium stewartii]|uniref:Uncharacterized protein n=1 Tax=Polyrhizophydium stewartii TaxID=2732419 RepID=A0ABR4NGR5_9FUNG
MATAEHRDAGARFDADVELDAYKFLGAYLGALTPLQYALLLGHDAIARDITERSFKEDLDEPFGVRAGAVSLQGRVSPSTFLGAKELVKLLLERGAGRGVRNAKGFAPVDVVDDADMRRLFQ